MATLKRSCVCLALHLCCLDPTAAGLRGTSNVPANCPFGQKGRCPRDLYAFSSRHCYTRPLAHHPSPRSGLARKTIAFVRFVQRRSTAHVLSVACGFSKYRRGRLYPACLKRVGLCSARLHADHRHRLSRQRHRPRARRHAAVHRNCHDHTPKSHCSLVAQRRRVRRHNLWHAFRHLQHFRHSDHLYRAAAVPNPATVMLTATVSNTS